MLFTQIPPDKEIRSVDLHSCNIGDTASDGEFNEMLELVSLISGCSISLITLIDNSRHWIKSKTGISNNDASRNIVFFLQSLSGNELITIEDATKDDRVCDNPMVVGELNIRFCAFAPIVSSSGQKLGSICIIDQQPKHFPAEQLRALTIVSKQFSQLLELKLKNNLIIQRANELDSIKTQALQIAIQEREAEKRNISRMLHENLSQAIATSKLYLDIAEHAEADRLLFITKTKDYLGTILHDMNELSHSIAPVPLYSLPFGEVMKEYLQNEKVHLPFEINFTVTGNASKIEGDLALCIFRIIEKKLQLLKEKNHAGFFNIHLHSGKTRLMNLEDNSRLQSFASMEKELITSSAYSRIKQLGGTIQILNNVEAFNKICISFPLI